MQVETTIRATNSDVFLNELRDELKRGPAVAHPFFNNFRKGLYSRHSLKMIFRELYILFLEIPKANLCLATNIEHPVVIESIRSHMIIELGAEEPDKATHLTLYRRFLYSLGLTRSELDGYSGIASSRAMSEGLRLISEFEEPEIAMGGFLCTETIAAPVQAALYEGLKTYSDLREEDLYYFALHSRIEVEHSDMVCDYLGPFMETGREKIFEGANRLAKVYTNYWSGIEAIARMHS